MMGDDFLGVDFVALLLGFRPLSDDTSFRLRILVEKIAGEPANDVVHARFSHRHVGVLGAPQDERKSD